MTTEDFIKKVHHYYQGDTDYPTASSSDGQYSLYLATGNDFIEIFATDPDVRFRSRWEEREFGTVDAGDRTYPLDADVFSLSDYVYIDKLDGSTVRFRVVDATEREFEDDAVYLWGDKQLTFTGKGDMAASLVGGTIRGGCFTIPSPLTQAKQTVPVDRPMWLVFVTAAELSRNDRAKDDQYANLIARANDEWKKMISANRKPVVGQSRRVRHGASIRRRF